MEDILPNATFGEDNEGQIIIYTDLYQVNTLTKEETDELVEGYPFIDDRGGV